MTTTREAQCKDYEPHANPQYQGDCIHCGNSRSAHALSTPATEPQGLAHIVDYTNWRGETARRVIRPVRMWWGKTEWHPEEQWMLTAWDCEKDAIRDFAWQDMRPVQNPATSAAARPDPQPAADTRVVTVEQLERWMDNFQAGGRSHTEIRAIIGTATPAPSDKIAEAALIEWLERETRDIETGEPLFDDAHIDVTAGEVRRRLAALAGQGETP